MFSFVYNSLHKTTYRTLCANTKVTLSYLREKISKESFYCCFLNPTNLDPKFGHECSGEEAGGGGGY